MSVTRITEMVLERSEEVNGKRYGARIRLSMDVLLPRGKRPLPMTFKRDLARGDQTLRDHIEAQKELDAGGESK